MSSQLIIPRVLDANGDTVSGAKAYVYETGTSTPVTVYQNTALSLAHANPIIGNGAGYIAQAFYGGSTALRVVVTDSADVTLVTYDPVPIVSLSSAAASSVSFTPTTPIPQTNVQDAIVSVQSTLDARVKPLENGARLVTSGGSSNAYTLTPTNAVSSYAAGQEYEFIANHANTGAATLNVSGLGGVAIQKYNASAAKVAMEAQDIAVGEVVRVKHDGTNFVLVNRQIATQAEAESGTDNVKLMTPLRTAQGIAALSASRSIATVTGSRSAGVDYANTSGADMQVHFTIGATATTEIFLSSDGATFVSVYNHSGSNSRSSCDITVPNGWEYRFTGTAPVAIVEIS